MRIIKDVPPLFDEIDAAFNIKGQPVIPAWGDKIYAPMQQGELSRALLLHEQVHGQRQAGDVTGWWRKYIADPEFRLAEEIPAHQAELAHLLTKAKGPAMRAHCLSRVAARLAAPLYGNLITIAEAKKVLTA
ncbi:MAG: hypothetical protein V4673_14400 [Pseudomonadota bacterium]